MTSARITPNVDVTSARIAPNADETSSKNVRNVNTTSAVRNPIGALKFSELYVLKSVLITNVTLAHGRAQWC